MTGAWWSASLQRFWEFVGGVSIRTKIFGIVLGSTLLLSLAFAIQLRNALSQALEDEAQEKGVSIARDVAARSTDLLLMKDLYSLYELLIESQANFRDVRYLFVTDAENQVLVHTFGEEFPIELIEVNRVAPDDFQHTVLLETEEGIIWDVAVPIFDGELGAVRVGISDVDVRNTLSEIISQLGITIAGVLGLSLLAATLLTWILTRPILGLVSAAQAVASGDFSPRVQRWANDEIGDLAEAFNQMVIELERTEGIRQEREQLRRQLLEGVIAAQEDERRRIARELHDSTTQSLTSLIVSLRNFETACENPRLLDQVASMRRVLSQTLAEVHNLALQLRPAALDDLGLEAALERYIQEWQARHKIEVDSLIHLGDQRLDSTIETALYRIIQEALTNISRHALASSVSVLVERRQQDVLAVIEDNGQGFDLAAARSNGRLGLLGMQERAELLGGNLVIESEPGQGASLFISIPIGEAQLAAEPEFG